MFRPLHLIVVISVGVACAQVQVPTRPGQTFRAWLDAFNSGDHARMESFVRTHTVRRDGAEAMMKVRETIGHLELLSTDTEPALIVNLNFHGFRDSGSISLHYGG
jgi:hypothetical protein